MQCNFNELQENINSYLNKCQTLPQEADWLLSDFNSSVWICKFEVSNSTELNWDKPLYNGTLLTSQQNASLLEMLKCWIIIATTKDSLLNTTSENVYKIFLSTIHLINYLLLNGKRLKIATHGLNAVTSSEITHILTTLTTKNLFDGIYDFNRKFKHFLSRLRIQTNFSTIKEIINNTSDIQKIDNKQLSLLEKHPHLFPNIKSVVEARALLMANDLYSNPQTSASYRKSIDKKSVLQNIFPNCVKLPDTKTSQLIQLLKFSPKPFYLQEFPVAPIKTSKNLPYLTIDSYWNFRSAFQALNKLRPHDFKVPPSSAFKQLESFSPDLAPLGRFTTIPSNILFDIIKNSIEFHLQYSEPIVQSIIKLVSHKAPNTKTVWTEDFVQELHPSLLKIGVKRWSLRKYKSRPQKGITNTECQILFFKKLRQNEGLHELLRIYIGCCQTVIGVLMARRVSELRGIKTSQALDNSGKYLIFNNRKSGLGSLNDQEARPIDDLAFQMIQQLQRIYTAAGEPDTPLFSVPSEANINKLVSCNVTYNQTFNLVCDYFEVPLDSKQRRYYIRQHQLRRFFAILFFYGHNGGKLETLQWFLGHSDPKHIYHYISDNTPGAILNGAKASFVAESMQIRKTANKNLEDFIESNFGSKQISVCDSEELEIILEDLLETGKITIEPHFFQTHKGQSYKILVKITETNQEHEVGVQ